MRIKIRHETAYTYSTPVLSAVQLLRLTPRSIDSQFVRQWRVSIDADARLDKAEDAFGNITHQLFVEGPFSAMKILVEGEVDTVEMNGLVVGGAERVPERLFLRETALTEPSPEIRDLARAGLTSEGGDRLAALHQINGHLHKGMAFDTTATSSATRALEAYAKRAGVCQDYAHIFCAAARSIGIPARYVSGYYLRTDGVEQDAGHAWAEAFIPELGWIAFDPTHGICVTERHVRVAIGSDSNEAAPIRGARTGGAGETLSVALTIAEGRAIVTMQSGGAYAAGQSQQ